MGLHHTWGAPGPQAALPMLLPGAVPRPQCPPQPSEAPQLGLPPLVDPLLALQLPAWSWWIHEEAAPCCPSTEAEPWGLQPDAWHSWWPDGVRVGRWSCCRRGAPAQPPG